MAEHMELPIIEEINGRYLASINAHYVTDEDAWRIKQKIDELRDENAKLRELVRIAVMYCDSGTCDGCPILGEDESCPYSDMARELGVETTE